jgi:hypothetical protein
MCSVRSRIDSPCVGSTIFGPFAHEAERKASAALRAAAAKAEQAGRRIMGVLLEILFVYYTHKIQEKLSPASILLCLGGRDLLG